MNAQPSSRSVAIRLLAAVLALAAGVAAVIATVQLARTTLAEAGSSSAAAGSLAAPAPAPSDSTPSTSTSTTSGGPRFPTPPPGSLALGQEAADLAVGLAVSPRSGKLGLQASVIGPDKPVNGLSVSFRPSGTTANPVIAEPCGDGCYSAELPVRSAKGIRVDLSGGGRRSASLEFPLPASLPAPSADSLVRRADRAWRGLKTLVAHERLSSGPGQTVNTIWRYKAPDLLTYAIKGSGAAIVIGDKRWDRVAGGQWQESSLDPVHQPVPLWLSATNARLLGAGRLRGRQVWKIGFFDPRIHAWFTLWVDRATMRTLELRMTAQSHFMHEVYGPFDAPMTIAPPTKAAR